MAFVYNILGNLNPLSATIVGIILTILISAMVSMVSASRKYDSIYSDLERGKKNSHFSNGVLGLICQDYQQAVSRGVGNINTQAIIEKHFSKQLSSLMTKERFVKKATSLMIIFGLLGTFYGLTLSIGKLVALLTGSSSSQVFTGMDSVIDGLINSVQGMSIAFSTSLFGIASSIVLTFMSTVFEIGEKRNSLMTAVEEYLDNTLASGESAVSTAHMPAQRSVGIGSAHGTAEVERLISSLGSQLTDVASSIEFSTKNLASSINKFDNSLNVFAENTRDFSEFNHHLKTNIQRMNVSFSDFADNISGNSKDITDGYKNLEQLSYSIERLSERIRGYDGSSDIQ